MKTLMTFMILALLSISGTVLADPPGSSDSATEPPCESTQGSEDRRPGRAAPAEPAATQATEGSEAEADG